MSPRCLPLAPMAAMVLIGLLACAASPARAQDLGENARLVGMSSAGGAVVGGIDAIDVNPALILLDKGQRVSFTVLPLGFHAGTDFISWGSYKTYFTGQTNAEGRREGVHLSERDKADILGDFTGSEGNFRVNGRYILLAAVVRLGLGALAFSITEDIAASGAIPKRFVEFLFNGNPPGERFDLSGLSLTSAWTRDYGVSAATLIHTGRSGLTLSLGATVKYVQGFGSFGTERFASWFETDPDSFVISGRADMLARASGTNWIEQGQFFLITPFPHPSGHGAGIDAGIHAAFGPVFTAGLALTDFGWVRWSDDLHRFEAGAPFTISDVTSGDQLDTLRSIIDGVETTGESFTTDLPAAVTLSAAARLDDALGRGRGVILAFAVRQGLNTAAGNSTTPRVHAGVEACPLPWLPIRTGISLGGIEPVTIAFGAGVRLPQIAVDIATGNVLSLVSDGVSSASFSLGWRVTL